MIKIETILAQLRKTHYQSSVHSTIMEYETHEIRLANEIAETLKDRNSLALFLLYTRKYKEQFLRDMLARVMSIEESKIRKTRGALFTFLVNQHGGSGNPRS